MDSLLEFENTGILDHLITMAGFPVVISLLKNKFTRKKFQQTAEQFGISKQS